jgi:gentisate 1,2-dioxygenase
MTDVTDDPALTRLYDDFATANLIPLWTEIGDLMPEYPAPAAHPFHWAWSDLLPLAERAGDLVPVGRGGERRAIALANPGLAGRPFATTTLWAAIQYLGVGEVAPAHRHSQGAFRFVVQGDGVWTVVNGDPVQMRAGDLLLTPSWFWHGHHHAGDEAMAWLDGLDIPLVQKLDASFFQYGDDGIEDKSTPDRSRSERLWAHPGRRPLSALDDTPNSPLMAYRWAETDASLAAQLELEDEEQPGVYELGHAAIRFTNPTTGRDALPTMRTEMHRVRAGARTGKRRTTGSAVWQVFRGSGTADLGGSRFQLAEGDLITVPSWVPLHFEAQTQLDLFTFSDHPVFEALNLAREEIVEAASR